MVHTQPSLGRRVLAVLALLPLLLLPVLGQRLTTGAAGIESNFPDAAAALAAAADANAQQRGYPTRLLTPLRGVVQTTMSALMTQSGAAFKAQEADFDVRYTIAASNSASKTAFFGGGNDFMVATNGPVASDFQKMPSLAVLPLQGNAIIFTYNLDANIAGGQQLALRPSTLCGIFRGNVTRWNDPAIQEDNPGMSLNTALADRPIKILIQSGAGSTQLTFVKYCNKVDPLFGAVIPDTGATPAWPSSLNSQLLSGLDAVISAVADTPYSFSITTLANAAKINMPIGAIINTDGQIVTPTANAQSLTLFELGTSGYVPGTTDFDLSNPSTSLAWPMMTMSYLYLDKTGAVSTCANKKMLLDFLLFFYTSDVVRSIAEALSVAAFPRVFVSTLGLVEQLQTELSCLGQPVYSSSTTASTLAVSPLVEDVLTLFSSFYISIDTAVSYTILPASESLAIQRVALAEQDFALVNTAALTDADVALLDEGKSVLIPAFLAGVSPVFTLPFDLTDFADLESTDDLNLPSLYPLKIDMELTARLFIGDVTSWLDPDLVLLNPQLPAWFTASGADPLLQVVVGATAPDDSMSGAKLLFQHMRRTATAAANPWAFVAPAATTGPKSNPFLVVIARSKAEDARANFTLIDTESRLSIKSNQISGSISYIPYSQFADPLNEFQYVDPLPEGADPATAERTIIDSSTTSLKKCSARYTSPEGSDSWTADQLKDHTALLAQPDTQRRWMDADDQEIGCWPITTLISFAVKTSYASSVDSSACQDSLHSLEFINYLQSTSILTAPTEGLGLVRLTSFPLIERMSKEILQAATCDDETLLIILPKFWTVSAGVTGFGQAIGILGLAVVAVSMAVVVLYRHKVVVRSASVPFLLGILLGMGLLIAAAIPWAVEPTRTSCSGFLWLANLGFMLLFCPLFAKTWRVYRIFSGAHLKVVKISNSKLLLMTAAVLLADLVLISAWQGVAPLVPVEYERTIGGSQHVFTHCSVDSNGSGMVFVGLVGAEKGLLLLFGAIMAFSTRNVKGTFNESTAISWTIYNTLLSAIIAVVLIVFVNAVEDTLVILVLVLLMWIVFSAWGLIFGPKFHLLTQSDEKVIEASRSQITQEKSNGFSFASIAAMTTGQIKHFYVALKLQVNKAERVLELPLTNWGSDATQKDDSRGFTGNGTSLRNRRAHEKRPSYSSEESAAAAAYRVDIQPAGKDKEADRERQLLASQSASSLISSTHPGGHVRATSVPAGRMSPSPAGPMGTPPRHGGTLFRNGPGGDSTITTARGAGASELHHQDPTDRERDHSDHSPPSQGRQSDDAVPALQTRGQGMDQPLHGSLTHNRRPSQLQVAPARTPPMPTHSSIKPSSRVTQASTRLVYAAAASAVPSLSPSPQVEAVTPKNDNVPASPSGANDLNLGESLLPGTASSSPYVGPTKHTGEESPIEE